MLRSPVSNSIHRPWRTYSLSSYSRPLTKTESVKLTFTCPVVLKAELERYAALHAQTYGEPVDAVTLIPHMLEAFIGRDRRFMRAEQPRS